MKRELLAISGDSPHSLAIQKMKQNRVGENIMIEGSLGLVVEGLVSVLLLATIFYCISVNKKLERLRSEQQGMHNFIRELSIATTNADKAIQGLRTTVHDTGAELAGEIDRGRNMSRLLKGEIEQAGQVMNRLIVLTTRAQKQLVSQDELFAPEVEASLSPGIDELRKSMPGFDDLEMEEALSVNGPAGRTVAGGGGLVR